MKEKLTIVLPAVDHDEVSEGLVNLTEAIDKSGTDAAHQGVLGGQFGYGALYENDIFMMHPFCWCEQADCQWCAGCECPDEAFHYYVDDIEVNYERYMAFFYEVTGGPFDIKNSELEQAAWTRQAEEANGRRTTGEDKVCRYCKGEWGNAPNFHHKATGFKVRWYKYLGRDMEIENPNMAKFEYILEGCLESLKHLSNSVVI